MRRALLLVMSFLLPVAVLAEDRFLITSVPLKQPRKANFETAPTDKMEFSIWIPDGVRVLRGVIVGTFTPNPTTPPKELRHWHVMARQWGFAFLQTDFNGANAAEFAPNTNQALTDFAEQSGHRELKHAPFIWMGTSRGGGYSRKMALEFPQRTLAAVPTNLEIAPDAPELREIPFWTTFGEKDGKQMEQILHKLPEVRRSGAQWGIAILWGKGHEFLFTNNLAIPFLDEVIRERYPVDEWPLEKPVALKPYPQSRVWLGDVAVWHMKEHSAEIAPADSFSKGSEQGVWLPGADLAHAWRAFVSEAKQVKITEPPGLGGGQAFVAHVANRPIAVKLQVPADSNKVRLYDGATLIEEKLGASTDFTIKLSRGVHPIYAVVELGAARLYSRPHTLLVEAAKTESLSQ